MRLLYSSFLAAASLQTLQKAALPPEIRKKPQIPPALQHGICGFSHGLSRFFSWARTPPPRLFGLPGGFCVPVVFPLLLCLPFSLQRVHIFLTILSRSLPLIALIPLASPFQLEIHRLRFDCRSQKNHLFPIIISNYSNNSYISYNFIFYFNYFLKNLKLMLDILVFIRYNKFNKNKERYFKQTKKRR